MRWFLVCLAIGAMALPAFAQRSNCAGEWARLIEVIGRVSSISAPAPGLFRQTADRGCRTDGLTFPVSEYVVVKADRLTWSGEGLARFAGTHQGPAPKCPKPGP